MTGREWKGNKMKTLNAIKEKGIKSIVRYAAAAMQDGKVADLYEVAYYTRQGNIALFEEVDGNAELAEILKFNASLPSFKQKKIQNR